MKNSGRNNRFTANNDCKRGRSGIKKKKVTTSDYDSYHMHR